MAAQLGIRDVLRSITRIGGSPASIWPTTRWSPQHRLTDAAWIDRAFNEFGWLNDNRTLWYESEESGYRAFVHEGAEWRAAALTQGRFEVSSPAAVRGRPLVLCAQQCGGALFVRCVSSTQRRRKLAAADAARRSRKVPSWIEAASSCC